jgi:cation:H+ antiporter
MSTGIAALVFVVCLIFMLGASDRLLRDLDQLGGRLRLSEGLLGLLTALGADMPEVSSAVAALRAGHHSLGLGVVLGSNLFNLAFLLGLGAVLAGAVRVPRASLVLDGGVGVMVTLLTGALVFNLAPPLLCAALLLAFLALYVSALGMSPRRLAALPLPDGWSSRLVLAVTEIDKEAAEDPRLQQAGATRTIWITGVAIVLALAVIAGGSVAVVQSAVTLAEAWRIPEGIVGMLLLAGITSLPNAYAATRLALHGRSAVLVSETFNSNSINLVVGAAVPVLVLSLVGTLGGLVPDLAWLLVMTLVVLAWLSRPGGLSRLGGLAVIGLYLLFVVVQVVS